MGEPQPGSASESGQGADETFAPDQSAAPAGDLDEPDRDDEIAEAVETDPEHTPPHGDVLAAAVDSVTPGPAAPTERRATPLTAAQDAAAEAAEVLTVASTPLLRRLLSAAGAGVIALLVLRRGLRGRHRAEA